MHAQTTILSKQQFELNYSSTFLVNKDFIIINEQLKTSIYGLRLNN